MMKITLKSLLEKRLNGGGGKAEAPAPAAPAAAAPPPPTEDTGPDPEVQAEIERQRALRYKAGQIGSEQDTTGTEQDTGTQKTLLGE